MKPPNLCDQRFSLISIMHRCKSMPQFKQTHAQMIVAGRAYPPSAFRPAISFSSLNPSGDIDYALLLVFWIGTHQTLFAFNTLIRGFAHRTRPDSVTNSVFIFNQLPQFGLSPNNFTFTFLYQCFSSFRELQLGSQVHSIIVKNSIINDIFVSNSVIHFYSVCDKFENGRSIFTECSNVDSVSWNSLISGYARSGEILVALHLFDKMPEPNEISSNSLLTGLIRCGYVDEATRIFRKMPNKNLVSWSAIISGYSQNGRPVEALELFREMLLTGMKPNAAVLVSTLSGASQLGALTSGKWIHSYIQKQKIVTDSILCAALIDMYAKCGSLELAVQVFQFSAAKDVSTYTAAISGLAMNGEGKTALQLFEQMKQHGIKPDSVTYIAVLCACSHMGYVQEGFYYYNYMINVDGLKPQLDHYACMVDLLGRAGLLMEAEKFIISMPVKPDGAIWGALLASCKLHSNPMVVDRIRHSLFELDPTNDGCYVILSNIYVDSGKGGEAEEVRRTMKKRKIRRSHGFSSVEVD